VSKLGPLPSLPLSGALFSAIIMAYGERKGANFGGAGSFCKRKLGNDTEFFF
jgi:hypothetical protein